MAPEIASAGSYDETVDIFSFTLTFYEMMLGKHCLHKLKGNCR